MRWLLTVTVGCLLIANALSKLAHTSKGNLRLKETSKHGDVKTHRRSWVRSSTDQDERRQEQHETVASKTPRSDISLLGNVDDNTDTSHEFDNSDSQFVPNTLTATESNSAGATENAWGEPSADNDRSYFEPNKEAAYPTIINTIEQQDGSDIITKRSPNTDVTESSDDYETETERSPQVPNLFEQGAPIFAENNMEGIAETSVKNAINEIDENEEESIGKASEQAAYRLNLNDLSSSEFQAAEKVANGDSFVRLMHRKANSIGKGSRKADISDVYEDPDQEDSQASKSSTGLGIVDEDSDSTAKVLQKALVGHLDYPIHTYPAAFHGDSHFDGAFLGHYDLGCHTTEDHCDSGISYPAHFHSGHIDCSPDVDLHCGHAITPVHHHHHHLVHHTPALHVALSDYGVHGQLLSNQEVAKLGLNSKSYLKQLGLLGQGNGGAGSKHRHHADCHPPADIAFLFEGCANASQAHFERWVAFAKHLVHRLPPSHDGVHYGAAVYSDKGVVKFDFERAYHMRHVIEELNGVAQTKPNHSQCNLGDGLRATKADLFDRTSRDYVYQVLIIFSNGNSSDDPASHARELRDSTVNIFYIATKSGAGVNAINVTQMNDVATRLSVDHVFQVDIDDLVDHFTGRHADSRRGDRGNDLDDDAYADSDDDDDDGGDDDADGGRSAQAHRLHDHFNHLYDYIPWHRCVVDVTYVINTCKFGEDQQQKVRTFLKDASRSLQIGRNGDHVAVVTARQEATIQWDLSRTWSHRDLDAAIDGLDLKNGETNCAVGKALNKTLEGVFLTKNRDPRNEFFRWINVTVFVADHHSSDDFKAASQALRDHGIVVHTVQWGSLYTNKDYRESTAGIASRPSEFYVHAHESIERLTVVSRRLSQYFRELTIGRQGENYKRPHGSASDYLNYDHDRDHHDDYDDELDGRREGAGEGAAAGDGNLNWKNEYGFADGYMKSRRKGHRAGWSSRFSSSRFGSSSSSSGGESSSSGGSSTSGSSTSGSSTSGSSMSGSSTSGGRLAGGSVSASGSFSGGSSSLSASGSLSANGRLSSPRFSQNPSPQGDVQVDAGRFSQNQPKKSVVGVSKEVRDRDYITDATTARSNRRRKSHNYVVQYPLSGVARSRLPVRNAAGGGAGRSAKEPGIGVARSKLPVRNAAGGGGGRSAKEPGIARIPRPAPMYRRHADPTAFNGMTDDVMRAGLLMKRTNVRRGEVTIGSGSSRADQRGSVARDRRDQVSVTMMGKGGSPRRVV